MTAAGAPAARCLTILLTLAVLLGHPGQTLGLQATGVAVVNPPSYEELATSLVVNQLALLQLMQDASNAASVSAEREALREEAAARDTSLQEMKKVIESLQEEQKDLKAKVENATQETLTGVAGQEEALQNEVTSLRQEMTAQGRILEEVERLMVCPDGWLRHEFSCYRVDGSARTWEASLAHCKSLDGDLAKITSAKEQEFVKENLGEHTAWIGLNDKAAEGHFVWTDGSTPTFTAWDEGQPLNLGEGEDCTVMYRDSGAWHDYPCSSVFGVVCERPVHI